MATIFGVAVLFFVAATACNHDDNVTWRKFAEQGYERRCAVPPGSTSCSWAWVKAEAK